MMSSEPPTVTDEQIAELLERHWPELCRRAARRAAHTIIWQRRLQSVNVVLAAAAVLMGWQAAWSMVVLVRLQGAAVRAEELVRLIVS